MPKFFKTSFSFVPTPFSTSHRGRRGTYFRHRGSHHVPLDCTERLRRELSLNRFGLDEQRPTKFATTSWMVTQIPYALYRAILLVYSVTILAWKASYETNYSNVETWLLALSTWTFILFTFYCFLLFVFTILQFFHDCLCNDDLSWYHLMAWVGQSSICNGAVLCFFGSIIHSLATSSGDVATQELFKVFTSDNPNFTYIIGVIMMIEIFLTNITFRLLHFIYPMIFYVLYFAFNIYRWGAGYTPYFQALDYGNHSSVAVPFIFVVLLVVCPLLHLLGFGIDTLRWTLLLTCIERHKKRFLEVASATGGATSYARGRSSISTRMNMSSRVCPTSDTTPGRSVSSQNKPTSTAMEQLFYNGSLAYL